VSLVIKPNEDGSADDYYILHGELRIGQIYKRKVALRPEAQWVRALNGLPQCANGISTAGLAASLDDAMAEMNARWAKWLSLAGLGEAAIEPE
jgi:hypothetical protein